MTQALRVDTPDVSQLEERLRSSLRQARGNLEIRNQLIRLARDPERFEALRRELGPTHALILELRALDPDADREPKKALAEERRRTGAAARRARADAPPRLWTAAPPR